MSRKNGKEITTPSGTILKADETPKPEDFTAEIHPKYIFVVAIDQEKTKSGVYLPEGSSGNTPIGIILSIGDQIKEEFSGFIKEGDYVYINPRYCEVADMCGMIGFITSPDAIFAKLPTEKPTTAEENDKD